MIPRPEQLVEILREPGRHGSGVIVAPGLVLTARHVVDGWDGDPAKVRVRRATATGAAPAWTVATEIHVATDPAIDVALIVLAVSDRTDQTLTIGVIDVTDGLPFAATGFPAAQAYGPGRNPETVRGVTSELSGPPDVLSLDVESAVAVRAADGNRPDRPGWSGLSGAAVFTVGGHLLGVVTDDQRAFGGRRLEAVTAQRLADDPGLRPWLPPQWEVTGRHQLSHLLAFDVGGELRVRVASPRPPANDDVRRLLRRSWLAPLKAKYQVVPFTGRTAVLSSLTDWLEQPEPAISYAVVSGPGGSGKSRLAGELCQLALDRGWIAGLASIEPGTGRPTLGTVRRPILLVLDYMDNNAAVAADLISGLRGVDRSEPVRIVFLARSAAVFLRRLRTAFDMDYESPAVQVDLQDEEDPADERVTQYLAAREAYAALHSIAPGEAPARAAIEERLVVFTTPLLVHARALLDVLDGNTTTDVPATAEDAAGELLDLLLDREDNKFWAPVIGELASSPSVRRQVMAVASFVDAVDADDAGELLTVVETLRHEAGRAATIAAQLHDLYSDGAYLPAVQPDLLGERLIVRHLFDRDRARRLFAVAGTAAQRSRMLEVLLRMCGSPYTSTAGAALTVLTGALAQHLPELVAQAIGTATHTDPHSDAIVLPDRVASALALVTLPEAAADAAEQTFPADSRLQHLSAVVYEQAVQHWQALGDVERAVDLLQKTTQAYLNAGRLESALPSSTEAMTYVSRFPAMSRNPRLGKVLASHAMVRATTGNTAAAVGNAERAVRIAVDAAAGDPSRYAAQLAEARSSLWTAYVADYDMPAARRVAKEAANVADTLPALLAAQALAQHGFTLMVAGEVAEAMLEIERARGHLTTSSPQSCMYTGYLATLREANGELEEALWLASQSVAEADGLPDPHSETSRAARAQTRMSAAVVYTDHHDEEALRLVEEARGIYRGLYEDAPALFGMQYATAWLYLAELLSVLGQQDRGVREAALAYALVEELYQQRPRLNYGLLVPAALARVTTLAAAERYPQALEAFDATIATLRRLDAPASAALTETLLVMRALLLLDHIEDPAGALASAREATSTARILAERAPETGLAELVGCLILTMRAAIDAELPDDALAAGDEAVRQAQRRVEVVPSDTSRRQHALVLALRGELYQLLDRPSDAIRDFRLARNLLNVVTVMPGDHDDIVFLEARTAECAAELTGADTGGAQRRAAVLPSAGGDADTLTALVVGEPTEHDPAPFLHRVVLGTYRQERIAAEQFRPVLVLGPQRSRKTTSLVTPTLLEWHGPALVTSVRTDVLSATVRKRRGVGEVSVFEPAARMVHGSAVKPWNPLDDCHTWEGAIVTARSLTESSRVAGMSGVTDSQYWYTAATQLLQSLLFAAARTGQSMVEVVRWVHSMENAEVRARLNVTRELDAIAGFNGIQALADNTRSSVYGVAATLLSAYDSSAVQRNSVSGFDVAGFFDGEPNTLYLCAPPEDQELLAPIFTALIRRVIAEAYRRQALGETLLPLLLLLDEAGNIATIESLDTLATTSAGTNIQLVTVFHDIAQIKGLYKESRAYSIANNHSALLLLPNNRDPETSRFLREILIDDRTGTAPRSLRRMPAGTAMCIYDNLAADTIVLRSSTHDEDLIRDAGPPIEGDPEFDGFLEFGRQPL
ncbi:type IV secretory system conjugative DNA transfer family protein [Dactylosporangium sp. NPDC005555]|uniref:type IV secretory system conjugative DNA transfer family protein n=1 Tax=Dactylosporangium sp. NPDC005555 TaxID=3154889 RepID=UPI0033AEE585